MKRILCLFFFWKLMFLLLQEASYDIQQIISRVLLLFHYEGARQLNVRRFIKSFVLIISESHISNRKS
jgi:hypothetical protein